MQPAAELAAGVTAKSLTVVKDLLKKCNMDAAAYMPAVEHACATACRMQAWGKVIVVASVTGDLLLFENFGSAAWS